MVMCGNFKFSHIYKICIVIGGPSTLLRKMVVLIVSCHMVLPWQQYDEGTLPTKTKSGGRFYPGFMYNTVFDNHSFSYLLYVRGLITKSKLLVIYPPNFKRIKLYLFMLNTWVALWVANCHLKSIAVITPWSNPGANGLYI